MPRSPEGLRDKPRQSSFDMNGTVLDYINDVVAGLAQDPDLNLSGVEKQFHSGTVEDLSADDGGILLTQRFWKSSICICMIRISRASALPPSFIPLQGDVNPRFGMFLLCVLFMLIAIANGG